MPVHVTVNLTEDPADLITGYSAGAKLYLDSASTEGGSYSNVTSTALVAGTTVYEFWDAAGTSATWYKSRAGNTGATLYSSYSPAFQATSLAAYASLMDLRETGDWADTSRDNLLLDLLVDASGHIDALCGRQFYRVPQVSGTSTFYVDVIRPGMTSLVLASGGYTTSGVPLDVLSVTTLGIRDSESDASYTTVTAGDAGYYLQPGDGPGAAGTVWPYGDVVLSPSGSSFATYPVGRRAVEIVGALGFPAVPPMVRRATVDTAREWYRQGPGGGPSQVGVNQFGVPVYLAGMPSSLKALVAAGSPYVRRTYASI
jgi:hypothetical protein